MFKLMLNVCLARTVNGALKTRWHELFSIFILSVFVTAVNAMLSGVFEWWVMILLFLVASVTMLPLVCRLNNSFVFFRGTGTVLMDVRDTSCYHNKDYVNDKSAIAELFQEEFIDALERAYAMGFKHLSMLTHRWVYENILSDPRVSSKFNITQIKEKGFGAIASDVLVLVSPASIKKDPQRILAEAFRDRKRYRIKMERRT